jgi:hypothetical protein
MSESNEPKKPKATVSNWLDDAARVLRISVEDLKKYRSDKPLRRPDPPKPPQGESGPAS